MTTKKTTNKSVSFNNDLIDRLKMVAEDERRSFSNLICSILENDERVKNAKVKQLK